jgi:hypothetical protein
LILVATVFGVARLDCDELPSENEGKFPGATVAELLCQLFGLLLITFLVSREVKIVVGISVLRVDYPVASESTSCSLIVTPKDKAMHKPVDPSFWMFAVLPRNVIDHLVKIFVAAAGEVPPYSNVRCNVPTGREMLVPKRLKMLPFEWSFSFCPRRGAQSLQVIEFVQHRTGIEVLFRPTQQAKRKYKADAIAVGASANSGSFQPRDLFKIKADPR